MVLVELGENMEREANKIEERVDRTARALNSGNVDYAVIGGNAMGAWLRTVGSGIHTRDVDILLRRDDTEIAARALSGGGFIRRDIGSHTMFLDGPGTRVIDAVHVVFSGELHKPGELEPSPSVDEYEVLDGARVISLEALTRMKLTAFRSKDRGHLIVLLTAGVINESMMERIPVSLRSRFQEVLLEREATRQPWKED